MSLPCLGLGGKSGTDLPLDSAPSMLLPKAGTSKYAFAIQTNHSCHLLCWYNLKRMEEIRSRHSEGKLEFQACDMKTRRQWFGHESRMMQVWKKSLLGALEEGSDYPAIRNFFSDLAEKGPVLPHVCNRKGKRIWRRRIGALEGGIRKILTTPILLVDYDALLKKRLYIGGVIPLPVDRGLPRVDTLLPEVEEQGRRYVFNESSEVYERVEQTDTPLGDTESVLGFEKVACEGGKGFQRDHQDGVGLIPFWLGLHKLMLLGLGIDENNQPIGESHPYRAVHAELRALMESGSENPWGSETFTGERYYPQAIASLLHEDEELKKEVEAVVDIYLPMYQRYRELLQGGKFFNSNGEDYNSENLDLCLPSREQALGYFWAQSLWFLLVGGISRSFFEGQMLGVRAHPTVTGLVGLSYNDCLKQARKKQKVEGSRVSFFDVLQKIHQRLKNKYPERMEWASYGGHGYVLSLDPELLERQLAGSIAYPDVVQELGVTLIDSLAIPGIADWFKENSQG